MEPVNNAHNPWLEATEDAPLPEAVTKAVNIARWAWKGLLVQGNAALQRVAQIQVPLLEDEAPIDTHTQNAWQDVADILTSLGAVLAEGIEDGLEATGDDGHWHVEYEYDPVHDDYFGEKRRW